MLLLNHYGEILLGCSICSLMWVIVKVNRVKKENNKNFKKKCLNLNILLENNFNDKIVCNKLDKILPNEITDIISGYNIISYENMIKKRNHEFDKVEIQLRKVFQKNTNMTTKELVICTRRYWRSMDESIYYEKIHKFKKKFNISYETSRKIANIIDKKTIF